jgi:hypothetical protein
VRLRAPNARSGQGDDSNSNNNSKINNNGNGTAKTALSGTFGSYRVPPLWAPSPKGRAGVGRFPRPFLLGYFFFGPTKKK